MFKFFGKCYIKNLSERELNDFICDGGCSTFGLNYHDTWLSLLSLKWFPQLQRHNFFYLYNWGKLYAIQKWQWKYENKITHFCDTCINMDVSKGSIRLLALWQSVHQHCHIQVTIFEQMSREYDLMIWPHLIHLLYKSSVNNPNELSTGDSKIESVFCLKLSQMFCGNQLIFLWQIDDIVNNKYVA